MKRLLMSIFPGDESWLWRRACCVAAILNEAWSLHQASDPAMVNAHGIVLLGVFATYSVTAVADKHSERQAGQGSTT